MEAMSWMVALHAFVNGCPGGFVPCCSVSFVISFWQSINHKHQGLSLDSQSCPIHLCLRPYFSTTGSRAILGWSTPHGRQRMTLTSSPSSSHFQVPGVTGEPPHLASSAVLFIVSFLIKRLKSPTLFFFQKKCFASPVFSAFSYSFSGSTCQHLGFRHALLWTGRSEDNLWRGLSPSTICVRRNRFQATGFGSRCLYPLRIPLAPRVLVSHAFLTVL